MIADMTQRIRKPKTRTPFGERLYAARTRAGLTQAELGAQLGMSQRGVANWEIRPNSSPSAEQLAQLAAILDVSVEDLVVGSAEQIRKKPGPKSKLDRVLLEAADLPRNQQNEIAEVVQMMVTTKKRKQTERTGS